MIFGEESKWASNVLHFTDWAEVVFSWSLPLHYKSEEKALLCKAFPVFMIFTYTSFDCVDYRPTTFNFCILSRFSSSEVCTYRSNVIVTEACPNISDNDLTSIHSRFLQPVNGCSWPDWTCSGEWRIFSEAGRKNYLRYGVYRKAIDLDGFGVYWKNDPRRFVRRGRPIKKDAFGGQS